MTPTGSGGYPPTPGDVLQTLRDEIVRDALGVGLRAQRASEQAEKTTWPLSSFWRRRAAHLTQTHERLRGLLDQQRILNDSSDTLDRWTLLRLIRAAGLSTASVERKTPSETQAWAERKLAQPRWLWKYPYRFRRWMGLLLASCISAILTFVLPFPSDEARMFTRIGGAGIALLAGAVILGLMQDRQW